MSGPLLNFIKANALSLALFFGGGTVLVTSGCGIADLFNFQPRSAAAQGGTFSQTQAFQANAKLADDAQRAGFIADQLGGVLPVGSPIASAISRVLDEYGKTLAVNLEKLDEQSKHQQITQGDVMQSQLGALAAGLAGALFIRKKTDSPAAS